jgi:hypothetical protein
MARSTTTFRIGRALLITFFIAATIVAALASFTTLVTGTAADSIWKLKENGYHQMLHHRIPIGLGFALLAVLLALTAIGWARRRRWGWLLSALIFGANLAADLAALVISRSWTNVMPVAIEGLILTWILLPRTKAQF